ncbi:hypothetical protein E2320_005691, partial [Naja naja]
GFPWAFPPRFPNLDLLSTGCSGAPGKVAYQLLRQLFANYSSALRPAEDTEQALNAVLNVPLLFQDERNQILTAYLWIRQVWVDAYLSWDKEDYGGIDSIQIPSSYVWRPDIVLYNNADDQFTSSMETNVVIRCDGQIRWDSPAITKSSCKVDVSYFPFDGQRCPLTFGSWTYNGNQIDLLSMQQAGDLTDFVENVEWEVLGMPATRNVITYGCCSEPYPDVTYTLLLRRRASFYVFNLLLPCIMISFLAPLGFYLPADSGEKVSLGVTVLLALTVFQLLFILRYMACIFFVYEVGDSCKSPLQELDPLPQVQRADGEEPPGGGPSPWEAPLFPGPGPLPKEAEPEEQPPCPRKTCWCHQESILQNVDYIANCFREQKAASRRTGEWKKVAKVMDRFFMWTFFAMVAIMSVLVMGQAV